MEVEKIIYSSQTGIVIIKKMPILHKGFYKFQIIPIEIPMTLRKLEEDDIITIGSH